MKFKSHVEIDGQKFYSLDQIEEVLSYLAESNYSLACEYQKDADLSSFRVASDLFTSSMVMKNVAKILKDYCC